MKKSITKAISVLLAAALMLCLCPAVFADNGDFDFEGILGGEEGYQYDKFDKAWTYYAEMLADIDGDYYIDIFMKTFSEKYGPNPDETDLVFLISNNDYSSFYEIESIDFLIGQDIYSFKTLYEESGYYVVLLGPLAQWFTEAIATTDIKDIAIRVTTTDTHYDYDAVEYYNFESFQHGCALFNEYFVSYYKNASWISEWENEYPLSINGQKVTAPYNSKAK